MMQTPMITSRPPSDRDPGRLIAHDAFLEPECPRPDRHGVPRHLRCVLRAPEHVDHVDVDSSGISRREAYACSPSTSCSFGFTGTIR